MNSTMRLLVTALLVFSGCRSADLFSVFKSDPPEQKVAESATNSKSPAAQATELSQAAASIPAATADQVRQGQMLVAAWYRDAKPETLTKARQHFEAALRQQPRNVDALHGVGIVADLQKQYVDAEKHYLLALAEQPSNSKVLGDLGYSYLLQKRLQESEQYLNRALVHDPNNQNAIKHLGDVYAQKGQVELARETYRRVLNETEIQQALAENSAAKPVDNRPLLDRLRDKPSADEVLANDIRQRMAANREQEQIRTASAQQHQAGGTPPPYPGNQPLHGDALRKELNNIDRERYANVSRGPIMLGGASEAPQQVPYADYQNNGFANQGQSTSLNGMSVDLATSPPQMPSHQNGDWSQQSGNSAGYDARNQPPAAYPDSYQGASTAQFAQPGRDATSSMPAANLPANDLARLTQPWGQPAIQAGAQTSQGYAQPGANVNPAYYQQQQQQQQQSSPYMQPNGEANSAAVASSGQVPPQGTPAQQPMGDPLQEASKAAARMGMGFGPGAMFPVISNAATQAMPGSSTMLNGASNPQPQRYLPTDSPPMDLRQQMNVQMPESQMITNQFGQQVPSGGANMTSPHQLGTASRYVPGNVPSQYQESYQNLQMYDNQRNQAAQDLNSAIRQVGGQQMQSAPLGGPGVAHPGGSVMYSPSGGSQYTAPHQQPGSPEPYPHNSRPAGSGNSAPEMSMQPQNASSRPAGEVVIPESYRNRNSSSSSETGTTRQPASGPSQGISGWDSDLPRIVPGR